MEGSNGCLFFALIGVLVIAVPLLVLRSVIAAGVRRGTSAAAAAPGLSEADVRRIVRDELEAVRREARAARGGVAPSQASPR